MFVLAFFNALAFAFGCYLLRDKISLQPPFLHLDSESVFDRAVAVVALLCGILLSVQVLTSSSPFGRLEAAVILAVFLIFAIRRTSLSLEGRSEEETAVLLRLRKYLMGGLVVTALGGASGLFETAWPSISWLWETTPPADRSVPLSQTRDRPRVFLDSATGCQYLVFANAATPRLTQAGQPACGRQTRER